MYEIYKEKMFSAAHRLLGQGGNCENLHGHNWVVRAYLEASELNELGMVLDFGRLDEALEKILGALDHRELNRTPPFDELNPTAEAIARHIHDRLADFFRDADLRVSRVSVWETPGACATYRDG